MTATDKPETYPVNLICAICHKRYGVAFWPLNRDGTIPHGDSHGVCPTGPCMQIWRNGGKHV